MNIRITKMKPLAVAGLLFLATIQGMYAGDPQKRKAEEMEELIEQSPSKKAARTHSCPKEGCTLSYRSLNDLKEHIKTYGSMGTCPVCSKNFTVASNTRRHIKHNHPEFDLKTWWNSLSRSSSAVPPVIPTTTATLLSQAPFGDLQAAADDDEQEVDINEPWLGWLDYPAKTATEIRTLWLAWLLSGLPKTDQKQKED